MKSIENLTASDVAHYVTSTKKAPCAFCGSQKPPAVLTSQMDPDTPIFTELKAFDAWGSMNPFLGSTPVIPLICEECGYLSHLTIQPVLRFLNGGSSS
ncbi:hypothetical protein J0676_05905 [Vibrio sp. Vb2880]|uniref:hypothetical protein n=1 Tax=Vibrio sp. Vb2880 TaxID=2816076 RepID=UPI001A8EA1B1|nr:hypothetical protein [Vibrio sp. Vb2880]MBO0213013.1 hypothetical protein [Vibrio sp. Vb2880]